MLSFFDSFFYSLNGEWQKICKPLKGHIEAGSPHFEFWGNVKQVLKTMYFMDSNNKKRVPSTTKNCIVTRNGMTFNQDPLENFFGQIRQCESDNNNECVQGVLALEVITTALLLSARTDRSVNFCFLPRVVVLPEFLSLTDIVDQTNFKREEWLYKPFLRMR
ncbi:hypothetical protein Trydic_g18314 [Trypoxylus dichotomus]